MFNIRSKDSFPMRSLVGAAFIAMVVINGLANLLPINGINTGAVSDSYPNLFAPSGFTFSIWGVIYSLLILYTIYQLGVISIKKPTLKTEKIDEINKYFLASSFLNIIWIFAWHYRQIGLSTLLIIAILYCLIKINQLVNQPNLAKAEHWLIKVPFGVYFGWITVATIANITTWLVDLGWKGFGLSEGFWTVAILIVGAVITMVTMFRNSNWAYGAVVIWAYAGILAKHLSVVGWNGQWPSVQAALYIILPILIILTIELVRKELPNLVTLKNR